MEWTMKKVIRVALSFASLPDKELNSLAILIIACLKTNALFPNLPVAIAALQTLQTAYSNALTANDTGGVIATVAKNEARDALTVALRQTAAYVQSLAPTLTLSQVLSSGFDVVNPGGTPVPLDQPVFTLDNSSPGQLQIWLDAVTNAKAYQVQFSTGGGAWSEAGIFPNTKNVAVKNLTAGTVYAIRIRAVGGSTQYSVWSATLTLMAT